MPKRRQSKKHQKKLFSHHRHTGKVLPHHHTSYPLVALLLLMVGVLLLHTTIQARAATVAVTATANGPLPPSPAVIQSPKTGDRFTDYPIPVSGTCPAPYFVKLFRNQTFSGSTQCKNDGTFLIYTDLFLGKNELEARIYNAADQEGPQSGIVTVYLDELPASASPTVPNEGQSSTGQVQPFFITSDIYFKAIYDGDEIDWRFDIVGGDMPFHVTVAWGDGGTSTLNNLSKDSFTVTHTYNKSPEAREYYPVVASITDADGRKASLQVFTILNNRLVSGLGSTSDTDQPMGTSWQRIMLAAYGVTVLMAISFWLGGHHGFAIWERVTRRFRHHGPKPRGV
jgi:hypothetical protein